MTRKPDAWMREKNEIIRARAQLIHDATRPRLSRQIDLATSLDQIQEHFLGLARNARVMDQG